MGLKTRSRRRRRKEESMAPDVRDYDKQVYGPITRARCPRCDKVHKLRLMWQGHGIPRIFCPRCRATIERNQALSSDDVDHAITFAPRFARTPIRYIEPKAVISEMDLIPHYGR
jgi:Zn ribbon nucleic-acid-binding protein